MMIQLNVLSGKAAGRCIAIRRFPFHIGRSPENHLALDDPGVWNQHLTLEFKKDTGIQIKQYSDALLTVNQQAIAEGCCLRNGDLISFGAVRLQFWLAAPGQHSLHLRENFVWALLLIIAAIQIYLFCLLPH